ncbi:hypothetical protein Drorol1_Dr00013130 [Drosera rotundifolia]
MFDKNGGLQALVQYPDVQTAVVAKEALEGHCIYDGGFCKLHLSYSRHTDLSIKVNNDRSRDYTMPTNPAIMVAQPSILEQQPLPMTGGAVAAPYNGMQFAPTPEGYAGPPGSASWGQSMPMQLQNYLYMPPGGVPPGALPLSSPPPGALPQLSAPPSAFAPSSAPPGAFPPSSIAPGLLPPSSMPLGAPSGTLPPLQSHGGLPPYSQ